MNLQGYVDLLTSLERETNNHKRYQAEKFYFAFRDENPYVFVDFTVQLIQQNHPQAAYATILFRRDCDKRGLSSALYQCPNAHEIIVGLLPYLLQQNHLLEIITQHLQLCLQKEVAFQEFLPFFQQLCNQDKQLAAQLTAEILTLPMSLVGKIGVDLVQLSMSFLGENDAIAALAMKALANYAFLHDGGLTSEQFYQILGRYQLFIYNDERTCDFKVLDAMNQQISKIIDFSKGVIYQVFGQFIQMTQQMFLKSQNKYFQLRMLKIGNKFISALENAYDEFPVIKNYLQCCVIPSVGMYENYQLEEWIQLGNIEFQADDLIKNSEKIVETMSIKWAMSVVNPALQECFVHALQCQDFKYQIACLMSLNFAAEGFVDVIPIESLDFYIQSIIYIVNIQNQHPRVLFSAANVIGQLANDFEQQIAKYQKALMPVLLTMCDHPIVHVRSHFVAAMLNVTITMPNNDLLVYQSAFINLVYKHWVDNDFYMKSNILSTLCTLIEISTEEELSSLLTAIVPQILDIFQQIMHSVSADYELTKTYLDLVQRVIEALGFAMSYFPRLFEGISTRVIEAYQQVMGYAYTHRVVDLLHQAVRSLIKTHKLADYTPIIAAYMQLFEDCCNLPFITYRKDVQGEGDMFVDTSVTDLQLAVFSLVVEEVARSPEYFVAYYEKILSGIRNLNSPNQTVSMFYFQLLVNTLGVAALVSGEAYAQHYKYVLEELKEEVDDTSVNGKHFEIETLQFVYQSFHEYFLIVRDNVSKYGALHASLAKYAIEVLAFYAEHTPHLLDSELALVAKVRADAGETQKLVRQLVSSYFGVYERLANLIWPLLEASGGAAVPPEVACALRDVAVPMLQRTASSQQQRDAPLQQLAIAILADLRRRGTFSEQWVQEYVEACLRDSDNPRVIYYCAYYLVFCDSYVNLQFVREQVHAVYQAMQASSSAFAGPARDFLALIAVKSRASGADSLTLLLDVQYDPLAVELAVRELVLQPPSREIAAGLRKMQRHATPPAEKVIEDYCSHFAL